MRQVHAIRVRLAVALVTGTSAGLAVPLTERSGLVEHLLVGFVVFGLAFAVPLLTTVLRADAATTRRHVAGEDPGPRTSDLRILGAGLLGLAGVAVLLVGGGGDRATEVVDGVIAVATVAVGWLCVHTIYTLRYARLYYSSPQPCIDFNQHDEPRYSDFAYFAFNLGMTYQVSDNNLLDSGIRRVVLGHCLLAYVFGTVVIASALNLVVGIGSS